MFAAAYEDALLRHANDDARPPKPSVIELARNAIGRENYRAEANGTHYVWQNGRWNGPLKLDGLMRVANERLKRDGKAQINLNPAWVVP